MFFIAFREKIKIEKLITVCRTITGFCLLGIILRKKYKNFFIKLSLQIDFVNRSGHSLDTCGYNIYCIVKRFHYFISFYRFKQLIIKTLELPYF